MNIDDEGEIIAHKINDSTLELFCVDTDPPEEELFSLLKAILQCFSEVTDLSNMNIQYRSLDGTTSILIHEQGTLKHIKQGSWITRH